MKNIQFVRDLFFKITCINKLINKDIFNKSALDKLRSELLESQKKVVNLEFQLKQSLISIGDMKIDVNTDVLSETNLETIKEFHKLYYKLGQKNYFTFLTSWLGYETLKCPLDLWIIQEIICAYRPDLIIETGTAFGGSSLFYACICNLIGHGHILTVDINECQTYKKNPHSRVTHLVGSSTDLKVLSLIKERVVSSKKVIVLLDSDHRYEHVLEELNFYQEFVPVGGYLVVEDTNINGNPAYPDFGPGPMEALKAFLKTNDSFKVESKFERFLLTMNPQGYLRRVK